MKYTLIELDQAFSDLWMHTNLLPTLLEKWQEMVKVFLAEVEPTESNLQEFEVKMDEWQRTLEENRTLIEAHQASLKDTIKSGEPSATKAEQSEKYKN